MNKHYHIDVSEILNIPEESLDDFLADLKLWYQAAKALERVSTAMAEIGIKPTKEADMGSMVWIDDGKTEMKLTFTPIAK